MNEIWSNNFDKGIKQMQELKEKIHETIDKFDVATKKLISNTEFEYYDEQTQIVDVPIYTNDAMTVTLKEGCQLFDTFADCWVSDNGVLYDMTVQIDYTLNFMDSPKLNDDIVQLYIDILLGMNNGQTCKKITFDPDTFNQYTEDFMAKRYSDIPSDELYRIKFTADDAKALFNELLSSENAAMFIEWLDAIISLTNEFEGSLDAIKTETENDK